MSPFSSFTVPEELDELLKNGSLTSLRRALHISPTNASVFAALARETASLQVLGESPSTDPDSVSVAEWYAEQAIRHAPDSVETLWSQAQVLLQMDKIESARTALAGAIRLQADNPNVLAIQSELARDDGQTNEAHALLARALNAPAVTPASTYLQLTHVAGHPDFFAEASLRNRTAQRLAGRPAGLPIQLLDLTPWLNGSLSGDQTNSAKAAPGFDASVLAVGGTPFDLRGVMGFSTLTTSAGKHTVVPGIPIGQRCARLHFLVANGPGNLRLRVHYGDGESRTFAFPRAGNDGVASWDNPRSETKVDRIDLIARPNVETWVAAITAQIFPDPVAENLPLLQKTQTGGMTTLRAFVSTPGEWDYQWFTNGVPVAGATKSSLELGRFDPKNSPAYSFRVRPVGVDPANPGFVSRECRLIDPANPVLRGVLKEELYLDIPGLQVADLLASPKYPDRPDQVNLLAAMAAQPDVAENYGRRISGWLVPKETAEYVFYICSDDGGRLSLSTDETPKNLRTIAVISGWHSYPEWGSVPPEGISKPIRLVTGKRYFIEALQKEGGGGDNLGVAWRKAGEPAPENGDAPIGGEFLELGVD